MSTAPTQVRDKVRAAFDQFGATRSLSEANEETTRCELIDVVLDALGWKPPELSREVDSTAGDWLDYELRVEGESWLVVEAKRSGKTFALDIDDDYGVRAISTLQRRGGATLRDALKQASGYCNDRAIPFACVTNGYQWIFFRGLSRRSQAWTSERALVFASAASVMEMFDDFLACLGRRSAGNPDLPRMLALPTRQEVPKAIVPATFLDLSRERPDSDSLEQVRLGARLLFTEIHGSDRQEMLRRCYISPGNEADFKRSIKSLLQDSSKNLAGATDTYEGEVDEFVDRVAKLELSRGLDHPIIVAGHVGAGKTTFIHRSLDHFRDPNSPRYRSAFYAYVDLEGLAQGGRIDTHREEQRVSKAILERLGESAKRILRHWMVEDDKLNENELEQADPFSPVALKTLLRKDLDAEYRLGEAHWKHSPAEWHRREYELIKKKSQDHTDLVLDFVRHLRARFRRQDGYKYPVLIVLDNLDIASGEFQRCVYGLASRLAKQTPAIVVVTLREDTYHLGLADGGFLGANPLEFVFHVSAPPLDRLVRRRISFASNLLQGDSEIGATDGWLQKMRKHSLEVSEVADFADKALLKRQNEGAELVASLAGHNTRDALSLIRNAAAGALGVSTSPDGSAEYLLECLMAVHTSDAMEGETGIRRCLDATPHAPPLHLLRLRLLAYLSWARETGHRHALLEATDALLARFGAWGYPLPVVQSEVRILVEDGLIEPVGASVSQGDSPFDASPDRVAITVLGEEHLRVLSEQPAYRALMACVCRWYDEELAQEFVLRATSAGGESGVTLGDIIESTAPKLYAAYLQLAISDEDSLLSDGLREREWVREVISRSRLFGGDPTADSKGALAVSAPRPPKRTKAGKENPQLSLLPQNEVPTDTSPLPRIPRNLKWRGTCWIPRILWALEWASREHLPPQTAAELGHILVTRGDIDVPSSNVARAFRELSGDDRIRGLWHAKGKRYQISTTGSTLIESLVADVLEED